MKRRISGQRSALVVLSHSVLILASCGQQLKDTTGGDELGGNRRSPIEVGSSYSILSEEVQTDKGAQQFCLSVEDDKLVVKKSNPENCKADWKARQSVNSGITNWALESNIKPGSCLSAAQKLAPTQSSPDIDYVLSPCKSLDTAIKFSGKQIEILIERDSQLVHLVDLRVGLAQQDPPTEQFSLLDDNDTATQSTKKWLMKKASQSEAKTLEHGSFYAIESNEFDGEKYCVVLGQDDKPIASKLKDSCPKIWKSVLSVNAGRQLEGFEAKDSPGKCLTAKLAGSPGVEGELILATCKGLDTGFKLSPSRELFAVELMAEDFMGGLNSAGFLNLEAKNNKVRLTLSSESNSSKKARWKFVKD